MDQESKLIATTLLVLKMAIVFQVLATKVSVKLAVKQELQIFVILWAAVLTLHV